MRQEVGSVCGDPVFGSKEAIVLILGEHGGDEPGFYKCGKGVHSRENEKGDARRVAARGP